MEQKTAYRAVEPGLISVCMSCYPGETIFVAYPELRGKVQISHGICQHHKAQWLAEIRNLKSIQQ